MNTDHDKAKYDVHYFVALPLRSCSTDNQRNPDVPTNLVAPYCAIPRDYLSDTPLLRAMGLLVSQHGKLGAIPPPPFLSVSPLESMQSGGAIPPPQKGYLSDTGAILYENKAHGCGTPLCDTISKGYCAIWGGISHWAAKPTNGWFELGGELMTFACKDQVSKVFMFLVDLFPHQISEDLWVFLSFHSDRSVFSTLRQNVLKIPRSLGKDGETQKFSLI